MFRLDKQLSFIKYDFLYLKIFFIFKFNILNIILFLKFYYKYFMNFPMMFFNHVKSNFKLIMLCCNYIKLE